MLENLGEPSLLTLANIRTLIEEQSQSLVPDQTTPLVLYVQYTSGKRIRQYVTTCLVHDYLNTFGRMLTEDFGPIQEAIIVAQYCKLTLENANWRMFFPVKIPRITGVIRAVGCNQSRTCFAHGVQTYKQNKDGELVWQTPQICISTEQAKVDFAKTLDHILAGAALAEKV